VIACNLNDGRHHVVPPPITMRHFMTDRFLVVEVLLDQLPLDQ
jgi:hypothetical protein